MSGAPAYGGGAGGLTINGPNISATDPPNIGVTSCGRTWKAVLCKVDTKAKLSSKVSEMYAQSIPALKAVKYLRLLSCMPVGNGRHELEEADVEKQTRDNAAQCVERDGELLEDCECQAAADRECAANHEDGECLEAF